MNWDAVTEVIQHCDCEVDMQMSAPGTCFELSGQNGRYRLSIPDWLSLWRLVGRLREAGLTLFSLYKLRQILRTSGNTVSIVVKQRTRWTIGL